MNNVEILQQGTNLLCKMPHRDTQILVWSYQIVDIGIKYQYQNNCIATQK